MSKAGNEYTDKQIEELERELAEVYSRAGDELEKKASAYFARFEKQDKEKQRLVSEGKMSKADYNKWRTASMTTGKHWKTLKEQSAKTLLEANKNATKLANDRLPSVYLFNYNDVGKDAQDTIKGFSFDLINEQALARMLKDKKTLLPYKVVDGKKVERWDTRKINAEVTQGIIQGESVQKIAKRFRNVSEMDKRYSLLNARTAMTGAENRGTLDGMAKLEDDGVILHKVWISAHDRRVRQSHQHIDGESVPVKEEFGNGLMYPGDPDGDPEEVYGCRCSMTTEIVGFVSLSKGQKENMQENGLEVYRMFVEGQSDKIHEYAGVDPFTGEYIGNEDLEKLEALDSVFAPAGKELHVYKGLATNRADFEASLEEGEFYNHTYSSTSVSKVAAKEYFERAMDISADNEDIVPVFMDIIVEDDVPVVSALEKLGNTGMKSFEKEITVGRETEWVFDLIEKKEEDGIEYYVAHVRVMKG